MGVVFGAPAAVWITPSEELGTTTTSGMLAARGQVIRFDGRFAFVRVKGLGEIQVGAALLLGADCHRVRSVGCRIPVGPRNGQSVVRALQCALRRQGRLLSRDPFKPVVFAEEDGVVKVNAFVDRLTPADEASRVRSALFVAAASEGDAQPTSFA